MATLVQAVRLALHYGEEHLGVTDIFGEDVGPPLGGVFTATQGLRTAWNSPLDERGIIGMAMGIAYAGGRPVAEIQFCDYGFNTIDLLKVAGNQRWAGAGNFDLPMVVMTPSGSGIRGSLYHSHSFESWASRLAGWKIVMPSNALDAYGLMLSAIADPNPVMVLLPKALLRVRGQEKIPGEPEDENELRERIDAPVGDRSNWKPRWPDVKEYFVPLGVARQVRQGDDVTLISYGRTLPLCAEAADELTQQTGKRCDVIDLRSIFPYDWKAISASVQKTGRVLIVNEDTEVTNFGEHLLRRVIDEHFYDLLARPLVLAGKHVPGIGLNQIYERATVPQLPDIKEALWAVATEAAQTVAQAARLRADTGEPPALRQEGRGTMEFALPEIGEGVYEAELVRWLVQPGEAIKRSQTLLEVMTDKATMEVPAPFAGTITALKVEPGQVVKVGQVVLDYTPAGAAEPVADSKPSLEIAAAPLVQTSNGAVLSPTPMSVRAAPSVRQMARKLGIDLTAIQGTGPGGRILVEDLTQRLSRMVAPVGQDMPKTRPAPLPDYGKPGTRIKLVGLRRRIAEHMVRATQTIPHYSYVDECDVSDLVRLRNSLKDTFSRAGIKLTYLPFFVKAVVAALKEVPLVNSSLEAGDEIVLHDRYHMGIAVATPAGLIVPVVRDADRKDIATLAREIERVSNDARNGRSRLEDLGGGTFTLTSVGNIGGLFSTPVINHPEVGILGIGKVVRRPVFDEAERVRPADIVYLSLSFDHRVVDGAVGASFTNAIIKQLKRPAALLLPEKL